MNKSELWGFEVTHIISAFVILAASNVFLNIVGAPLFISWFLGIGTLITLRVISHGQQTGHLELLARYILEPHLYLGHKERTKS